MQYTEQLRQQIFDWTNDFSDITEEDVLEFLSTEESFLNFGELLTEFISDRMQNANVSPKEYLKKRADDQEIYFNKNTLNNWFSGKRPKKGDQSREHMYKIAFALHLSVDDTAELFQKVYYDKPFNMRSIREFLYYYSLKNSYSYAHADSLVQQAEESIAAGQETTIMTQLLITKAQEAEDDSAILEYIRQHPHNFQISSRSAISIKNELVRQILPDENEAALLKLGHTTESDVCSYIGKEISHIGDDMLAEYKNKSFSSISTMIDIIVGIDMVKTSDEIGKGLLRNTSLLAEIKNRFPSKHSFSTDNLPFEEMRKLIILLYSYRCWFDKQYHQRGWSLEEYIEELNAVLFDASLPTLYIGNPYDWMFMYCTMCEYPLDAFREIMAEALIPE